MPGMCSSLVVHVYLGAEISEEATVYVLLKEFVLF